jgi:hypothetical protein
MNEFDAWQQIVEEWKQVDKMKKLNQRLYDELGGCLMYILEYSEKNNIVLPNRDRLFRMVDNIHKTMDTIWDYHHKINGTTSPTKMQQPNKTTEDSTEPIIIIMSCSIQPST